MAGFIKQHLDLTIDEDVTQLFVEMGEKSMIRKKNRYARPVRSQTPLQSLIMSARAKHLNIEGERKKRAHREGPGHQNDRRRANAEAQGQNRLGAELGSFPQAVNQEAHHLQEYPVC